jgi:hypothetical protein
MNQYILALKYSNCLRNRAANTQQHNTYKYSHLNAIIHQRPQWA